MKTMQPHTPIQYVIGHGEFCGLDIGVDENVLIPRPETELLVDAVAMHAKSQANILDLCTGSGCIAIALMVRLSSPSSPSKAGVISGRVEGLTKRLTNCTITASDISQAALDVAIKNAKKYGVSDKIRFIKSDLFGSIESAFDIIVSNPPYIARYEFAGLNEDVLREPRVALDGGEDGLDFYRKIFSGAPGHLNKSGRVFVEIGFGQKAHICKIAEENGFIVRRVNKDHNGIDRIVEAEWISS